MAALVVAGAAMMAGCASPSTVGDHIPSAVGGLPEAAPARPATPTAYPAVHDMPPERANTTLTDNEQKKLEDELIAARNRVGGSAEPASTGTTRKASGSTQNQ